MLAIAILGAGSIQVSVPAAVTAALAPGRYYDALRVVHQDLSDTVWVGVVNVDADPFFAAA